MVLSRSPRIAAAASGSSVTDPDVMAHIPGTQMNRDVQERSLTNRLNQENTENEQNLEHEALTAKANEETAAAPGKNASEEALQEKQTENLKESSTPASGNHDPEGIFAFNPHTKELTPADLSRTAAESYS